MVYWRLYDHFVWGTKGRHPLILPVFERNLYRAIHKKSEDLGAIIQALDGYHDHIHLAVSIPPKISIV